MIAQTLKCIGLPVTPTWLAKQSQLEFQASAVNPAWLAKPSKSELQPSAAVCGAKQ